MVVRPCKRRPIVSMGVGQIFAATITLARCHASASAAASTSATAITIAEATCQPLSPRRVIWRHHLNQPSGRIALTRQVHSRARIRRTHQPADGGLVDVQQPRHCALRFAGIEQLQRLFPLMLGQLRWPTELDASFPRPPDAGVGPPFNSERSNSANPPRMVIISLPCGVVVSAQPSANDLKAAPRSPTMAAPQEVCFAGT